MARSALKTALAAARFGAATAGLQNLLSFWGRAPDHQQFADMLYRSGAELFADAVEKLFADFTVIVKYANLDQFMAFEASIDLFQDRFCQAILADGDNRIECMGTCAQGAALVSGNIEHSVNLYKERILPNFGR